MAKDPIAQLLAMPSVQVRVDAIAEDLKRPRRQQRYAKVPAWELASDILEIDLEDPDEGASTQMYWRRALEDMCGEMPAFENLTFLQTIVSASRFATLSRQAERISAGTRSSDLRLTPRETRLLEDHLALEAASPAYLRNSYRLTATDGTDVWFEAIEGDGGDVSDVVGPYELQRRPPRGESTDVIEADLL